MNAITDQEATILAHTSRTGRYVTDEPIVIAMAERGLLKDHGPQRLADGMHYFTGTTAGNTAMRDWQESQPKPAPPPKLTKRKQKAKARYRRWLDYGEGFRSFRDFLTWDTQPERSWN